MHSSNSTGQLNDPRLRNKLIDRKVASVLVFSTLFGLIDLLAQYASGNRAAPQNVSILRAVLAFVISALVAWLFFSILDRLAKRESDAGVTWVKGANDAPLSKLMRTPGARTVIIASILLPLIAWLFQYALFWPMAAMNDTYTILASPRDAAIAGHPLVYNYVLDGVVYLGQAVFGSYKAGIVFASLVQLAAWVFVFSATIVFLIQLGVSRPATWALIAYATVVPIVGNYSFALVKDSVFSIFVVALIPVMVRIYVSRGDALRSPGFLLWSLLVFFGFATSRNNGLAILGLILALAVFYAGNARWHAVILSLVALVASVIPTVVTSTFSPDNESSAPYFSPLQALGYTYVVDPECVSPEDRQFFDQIMPRQVWVGKWHAGSIDPVAESRDFSGSFLTAHSSDFMEHWLSTAARCPGIMAAGYLVNTQKLWRFDPPTIKSAGQSFFTITVSNRPANRDELIRVYAENGVVNHSLLPEGVTKFVEPVVLGGLHVTPGAGTWLWLTLLIAAGFIYRRRGEWLTVLGPSLLIWATLLVAAPATYPFRYVQFITWVVPIALTILLGIPRLERVAKRKERSLQPSSGEKTASRVVAG